MSALSKLQAKSTGCSSISDFRKMPIVSDLSTTRTDDGRFEEVVIKVTLGTFQRVPAEVFNIRDWQDSPRGRDVIAQARRLLANEIYGEVRSLIQVAIGCVSSGDSDGAMEALNRAFSATAED